MTTKQHPHGVALVIHNAAGKILVLQELSSKPELGKYRGMYSIPMETVKRGESIGAALGRLINEELPGLESALSAKRELIGQYQVAPEVWATLYQVECNGTKLPSNTAEVGSHTWIDPTEALKLWLRQGAQEMIADFIAGKKKVICNYCNPPIKASISH